MTEPHLDQEQWRVAIAAEMRSLAAVKRVSGRAIVHALGKSPAYLSRRMHGLVPFTTDELLVICDLMDEDITRVLSRAKHRAIIDGISHPCHGSFHTAA